MSLPLLVLYTVQTKTTDPYTVQYTTLGWGKTVLTTKRGAKIGANIPLTARWFPEFVYGPKMAKTNSTRHDQANIWVYNAINQDIFPIGFIRLLRQSAGITAKLVSSSTKLRTPSQDLSSMDSPLPTHPTQGSVPFSTPQSLRLPLPFQFSWRCA